MALHLVPATSRAARTITGICLAVAGIAGDVVGASTMTVLGTISPG
jgi:hypothetical protein